MADVEFTNDELRDAVVALEEELARAVVERDAARRLLATALETVSKGDAALAENAALRAARTALWEALDNATDQLDTFETEGAAVAGLGKLLDVLADNAPPEKVQRRQRRGMADA